ncbi:hypothetical protein K7X08_005737 [Anisodus acutangulus]|uniref:Uncharacterized protein n=1 Tax=Anisodus acutangulus TaxID=402998 RepID=A0A9Q1R768_9SOLA|nr:hypothetical protein K7X08_005737 [Anisodus acutangulus]
MGWKVDPCALHDASLADGNSVPISGMCKGLEWLLHSLVFRVDFLLLPLGTCDMVLGVQWLSDLRDIMFNFKKLTMKFKYDGKMFSLEGITPKSQLAMVKTSTLQKSNEDQVQLFMIKVNIRNKKHTRVHAIQTRTLNLRLFKKYYRTILRCFKNLQVYLFLELHLITIFP